MTAINNRRRLRFSAAEFIAKHHEAEKQGLTLREFAAQLGITYMAASMRVHALKVRGVVLPRLKHGLTGRPSNRRKGKDKVTRSVVVPAGQTVRIDNGSDRPITITIGG